MSGHSKWSTIKRQKGKTDAARAKVFTKIGREMTVSVKMGGAEPANNSRLRDAIAKARAANMPNDVIQRCIKRAAGETDSANYESVVYEGYGINGVAVIVETLTDNRNRTGGEVRHIFDKYGGGLGATGCVSYMFDTKGVMRVDKSTVKLDEDDFVMACLEYDVLDVVSENDEYVIYTTQASFSSVRESLATQGYTFVSAQVDRIPNITATLDDEALARFEQMLDKFEDNDDVQEVYYNLE